jgi:hypothetical protein
MERHSIGEDQAFELLRAQARSGNELDSAKIRPGNR